MSPARVPMDEAHLIQYAVNTAKAVKPVGRRSARALSGQVKRDLTRCTQVREGLSAWSGGGKEPPGAVQWLMDN